MFYQKYAAREPWTTEEVRTGISSNCQATFDMCLFISMLPVYIGELHILLTYSLCLTDAYPHTYSSNVGSPITCGDAVFYVDYSVSPTTAEWTPATCDEITSTGATNYDLINVFELQSCCDSGLTVCDTVKTVPQMCQGGTTDQKLDSTVVSDSTCREMKSSFQSFMPASSYPFSSWTSSTCNVVTRSSYTAATMQLGYTTNCCNSQNSACMSAPTGITFPEICSAGSTDYKGGEVKRCQRYE